MKYPSTTDSHSAVKDCIKKLLERRETEVTTILLAQLQEELMGSSQYHANFHSFLQARCSRDLTWKFWVQFVFQDAFTYVGFYLAIRSGNWYLRTAALKEMAPLFTCYDHFTYRKLIAQHVADILCYPAEVLCTFKHGAFVMSIMGHEWHCVGVDEAPEMLINRACKTSIVHPSKDYIIRISNYLPYRARCIQNIKKELQLENNAQNSEKITNFRKIKRQKECG